MAVWVSSAHLLSEAWSWKQCSHTKGSAKHKIKATVPKQHTFKTRDLCLHQTWRHDTQKDNITQRTTSHKTYRAKQTSLDFCFHIYISSIALPNHWQNGRMYLFSCPTQPLENHSVTHLDDCWIIWHSISWHQCLSRFLGQGWHCQAAEVVPRILCPGSVQRQTSA